MDAADTVRMNAPARRLAELSRSRYSTGDIVLFSGRSLVSQSIRWRTWSRYSHIGVAAWTTPAHVRMAYDWAVMHVEQVAFDRRRMEWLEEYLGVGRWLLYESTTLADRACCISGEKFDGIQAHPINERISEYNGTAYLMKWRPRYVLTSRETGLLPVNLLGRIGTPYDYAGAALLGSCVLKHFWPYESADRMSAVCCAMVARQIGELKPGKRLPVKSPRRWTPGSLARTLQSTERCEAPRQISKTEETKR